jgi:hypothetical protein
MKHPEHPVLPPVGEGRVSGIESLDVGCECQHIPALNPVSHLRDAFRRHYPAWLGIETLLHGLDFPKHSGVGQGRVTGAMPGHETKRPRVSGASELTTTVLHQAAFLPIADPLAEVVQP